MKKIRLVVYSLLFFFVLSSGLLLLRFHRANCQKQAAADIGNVKYDFQFAKDGSYNPDAQSPISKFWLDQLGQDFFHSVVEAGPAENRYVLRNLPGIKRLYVFGSAPRDLMDLQRLSKLEVLDIENLPIVANHLHNLPNLHSLKCSSENLEVIGTNSNLRTLRLSTYSEDWRGLTMMDRLTNLEIISQKKCDLESVAKVKNLKSLKLSSLQFPDISPLEQNSSIENVELYIGKFLGPVLLNNPQRNGKDEAYPIFKIPKTGQSKISKLCIITKFIESEENLNTYHNLEKLLLRCENNLNLSQILQAPNLKSAFIISDGFSTDGNDLEKSQIETLCLRHDPTLLIGTKQPLLSIGSTGSLLADPNPIPKLKSLKHLRLHSFQLKSFSFLKNFPNLETLVLDECVVAEAFEQDSSGGVDLLFQSLVKTKPQNPFQPLSTLPNFRSLAFIQTDVPSFLGIEKVTNLKQLIYRERQSIQNIQDCRSDRDFKTEELKSIAKLKNLKELNVTYSNVDSLDSLKDLKQIETLRFSCKNLKILSAFPTLSMLKNLQIKQSYQFDRDEYPEVNDWLNSISKENKKDLLLDLSFTKNLKALEQLQIPHNKAKGIDALHQLPKLHSFNNVDRRSSKKRRAFAWRHFLQSIGEYDSIHQEVHWIDRDEEFPQFRFSTSLSEIWNDDPLIK